MLFQRHFPSCYDSSFSFKTSLTLESKKPWSPQLRYNRSTTLYGNYTTHAFTSRKQSKWVVFECALNNAIKTLIYQRLTAQVFGDYIGIVVPAVLFRVQALCWGACLREGWVMVSVLPAMKYPIIFSLCSWIILMTEHQRRITWKRHLEHHHHQESRAVYFYATTQFNCLENLKATGRKFRGRLFFFFFAVDGGRVFLWRCPGRRVRITPARSRLWERIQSWMPSALASTATCQRAQLAAH